MNEVPPAAPPTPPCAHRAALVLSAATLALVFIGGLVTSTHSGLAVPDWPLSYGRLMPPMVGGVLFEHGHRMAATVVGLMTMATVFFFRKDPRGWLRRAAWAALGLVVLQGVFGGLTVMLKLPPAVSIVHATLAQTYFCLTVALAVWSSPAWSRAPDPKPVDDRDIPLPHLALLLVLLLYLQLVLGAVVRHTGRGISFHIVNAGVVLAALGWAFRRVTEAYPEDRGLWRTAVAMGVLLLVQSGLGLVTLMSFMAGGWPRRPELTVFWATAHVGTGALLLGTAVLFLLLSWRRFPGAFTAGRARDYVALTKPGISVMAAVSALAGYALGSRGGVEAAPLLHTAAGTLAVSGGACALNMLFERDVDARMRRTASRPLPSRRILPGEALFVGALLLAGGLVYLAAFVNGLTAALAGLTASIYLYLYTPLKKISWLNTACGAVAGALPPVIGWAAAAGRIEGGALVLFAILFFWQFPHFFSLAWLYREDYARAGLAMLPAVEPDGRRTARQILAGSAALLGVSLLPAFLGMAGAAYGAVAGLLGAALFWLGLRFRGDRSPLAARRLFFASVLYLPAILAVLVAAGRRGAA